MQGTHAHCSHFSCARGSAETQRDPQNCIVASLMGTCRPSCRPHHGLRLRFSFLMIVVVTVDDSPSPCLLNRCCAADAIFPRLPVVPLLLLLFHFYHFFFHHFPTLPSSPNRVALSVSLPLRVLFVFLLFGVARWTSCTELPCPPRPRPLL